MIGGSYFEWTHEDYKRVVDKAIKNEQESISLDTEHHTANEERMIVQWAKNDGFEAIIKNDSVKITLKNK